MKRSAYAVGVLIVAACAAVSGCDPSPAAPPSSHGQGTSSVTPSTSSLPYAGAPKVGNPLPVSVLSDGPCAALTQGQVQAALGQVVQGKPDTTPGVGPSCSWSVDQAGSQVDVGYATQDHQGLSAVYQNSKPKEQIWRELQPIQGFPAVAHATTQKDISTGFCQVSIGIADDLSIDVSGTLGQSKAGKADPCTAAAQAAGLVLTTLRQKAGA